MSLSYNNTLSQSSASTIFNNFLTGSITTYTDDRLTKLQSYFLQRQENLQSLILPNVISISDTSLDDCINLNTLLIRSNYYNNALSYNLPKLTHFILNDDYIVAPYIPVKVSGYQNGDLFSPLVFNIGGFYVPQSLLNDYKNATNWSAYADMIYSIENDYNPSVIHFNDTITDTWSEIASSEDDNSYKIKYHIGDTKTIAINGTYCKMQIIDFNKDIIANDNEDTAKITWMTKYLFNNVYTTSLHYSGASFMNSLYDSIQDQTLKSLIKTVKKPTFYKNSVQTFNLKIWSLSGAELGIPNYVLTEGVEPYSIFTDNNTSRIFPIAYIGNTSRTINYRTRSSYNANYSLGINNNTGEIMYDSSDYSSRQNPFGFCT